MADSIHPRAVQAYPTLIEVKKWLPDHVFEKSAPKSLGYFFRDASLIAVGVSILYINPMIHWDAPFLVRWMATCLVQIATGFVMWCMFVVGHDCGHGTFSTSKTLNRVMGEVAHSVFLCTPFYPWKLSHAQHHLHHNHQIKDYSHTWKAEGEKANLGLFLDIVLSWPIIAWPLYLYGGVPDGGHLILYGRLWKGREVSDWMHGYISSAVSLTAMTLLWQWLGWNHLVRVYLLPWLVFSFFLFTVTFLQHHDGDTLVYTDRTWKFAQAAFETVDRTYGLGIDAFHHHISNCHVVHHLFFTKIPHYNLFEATRSLRAGLDKNGYRSVYKHINTPYFFVRIFTYLSRHSIFLPKKNIIVS